MRGMNQWFHSQTKKGPFWIYAFSIYQNNDPEKGITISEQLGSDPEFGPFATVLNFVPRRLVAMTEERYLHTTKACLRAVIYSYKWCTCPTCPAH